MGPTRRAERGRRGALALLLALLAACGSAPTPPSSPTATPRPSAPPCDPDDPDAWGLFATVTDPSGAPIEGAVVDLQMGEFVGTARTDAEGRFRAACTWGTVAIGVGYLGYEGVQRTIVVDPGERREITLELEPADG